MRNGLEVHPAVLLFSHRSYIDGAVVPVAMQENRLPPVHVFAGINLSFGLMGPLLRRSGVIFIRRDIANNPLYKYVLREYVGYIVEKRFNLSWSIEGTRSRTGKMLPPKLGLMSYVADAYLDGRSEDILLQPVSIGFDQLHETAEYAAYARGGEKTPEGVLWLYNFIKAQGERNYGKIYVRFPEAVSMRQYLGPSHGTLTHDNDAKRLALQKMSFEVAWRILRATPVTATGLVCALLLTTRGAALTLGQLHHTLQDSLDYLDRKNTPVSTSALRLRTRDGVRAAVDALSNGHPITRVDSGREPVWLIAPDKQHAAAFYRNSVIHAFLETSIVELALAHARHTEDDRIEAFWAQAMRLRDLLKFDFYFADSAAFRDNIAEEMAWHDDWEAHVAAGGEEIDAMLFAKRPLMSDAMLRVFFEAYEIVADVLRDAPADIGQKELTELALGVGRQYVAQTRVRSSESVSTLLFATARQVVADQDLIAAAPDLTERRIAFLRELRAFCGISATSSKSRAINSSPANTGRVRSAPLARLGSAGGAGARPYPGRMTVGQSAAKARDVVWPLLSGVAVLAGCTAAGIGALSLADALTATGLPNPGPATTLGLPFVRAAGEIAAVLAVGSFLFAAFLVPPQKPACSTPAATAPSEWGRSRRACGRCAPPC